MASNIRKEPPGPGHNVLGPDLTNRLAASFSSAYGRSWSIPPSAPSLSEEEIRFLRTHTVNEIRNSQFDTSTNPVLRFCMQVVQVAFTQAATQFLQGMIESAKSTEPAKKNIESTEAKEIEKPHFRLLEEELTTQGEIESENKPDSLSEKIAFQENTSEDPSLEAMKNIASTEAKDRIQKSVFRLLEEGLTKQGEEIAQGRLLHALSEGHSLTEGSELYLQSLEAQRLFIKYSGKTIEAAIATGEFFTKVEEMGWQGALADTTKDALIGLMAKYGATTLARLAGCTNPVWCVAVMTTVIKDLFVPTPTAGPAHDMYPPEPIPPLSDVTRSQLPTLDPAEPSLRPPKNANF